MFHLSLPSETARGIGHITLSELTRPNRPLLRDAAYCLAAVTTAEYYAASSWQHGTKPILG